MLYVSHMSRCPSMKNTRLSSSSFFHSFSLLFSSFHMMIRSEKRIRVYEWVSERRESFRFLFNLFSTSHENQLDMQLLFFCIFIIYFPFNKRCTFNNINIALKLRNNFAWSVDVECHHHDDVDCSHPIILV